MTDTDRPMETRALLALYRNHPDTPPGDRYGWRAKGAARARREMLLAWAATLPDYRLRDCRNIGAGTVAWIRANQPSSSTRHVHDGQWCAACVQHGRSRLDSEALYRALLAVENHGAPIVATDNLAIAASYSEEVKP